MRTLGRRKALAARPKDYNDGQEGVIEVLKP